MCELAITGKPVPLKAIGFIKPDESLAKLVLMHVACENCQGALELLCSDPDVLQPWHKCGPSRQLGTFRHDDDLQISQPGLTSKMKIRFHRFPLLSGELDTSSKTSFSVEIEGVEHHFERPLRSGGDIHHFERPEPNPAPQRLQAFAAAAAAQWVADQIAESVACTGIFKTKPREDEIEEAHPEAQAASSQQGHLLLSGRFNNDEIIAYMRAVKKQLEARNIPVFMAEATVGQSFADLTRIGLARAKGMVAFCTSEYGAYTGVGYETFYELEFAHDHRLPLFPIRLCEQWPPAPQNNERGIYQNQFVFKNGLVYIDDREMTQAQWVADQIAESVARTGMFKTKPREDEIEEAHPEAQDKSTVEVQQSGITLRMTKSMYDKFCPRVELLEDWADLRDSHSLLEVMPSTHTVLSPLLRLTPEDVDFPTSIEVEVPTRSGAESAWRSTATGWENVEISLVRGCAILVLRHFCDVIVSGPCAIRAMGFIKLDQPVAKLAVMHVGCEGCRYVLNQQYCNDDEELRGFRECGPTARLGTYNPDENLNITVPGAGCVQLKMRFHRFPLVSPNLDTPSKMSFSVEIDGDTFDFAELELKPRPPNTQVGPSPAASSSASGHASSPLLQSVWDFLHTALQVCPSPAASSSASGHASSPLLQSVQASQPEGHLLLSGRFKSDRIFTAEQIMGYMRMVRDRLAVRGVPTFMVEAKPGQSFAELTRMGLGRAKGMVAFCTAEYGAYTGVGYETFRELEFAHDKELLLIPIRLCEAWPPAPTDNERGTWQNKLVFTKGLVYIDDQEMENAEGVADQIADSVAHLGLSGDATNS